MKNNNSSKNTVIISGNIVKDANTNEAKTFAAFDIAHNAGKDNEPLFDSVKMFAKNGNQAVEIPFDLLVKGNRVLVKGFRRTEKETFLTKSGETVTRKKTIIVAVSVEPYAKGEENKSQNSVVVSGNLCADANKSATGNFAGFDLAHNAGKDNETMFDSVKMFSRNGKQEVEIPMDVLTKGRRVLVSGYRRCEKETFITSAGETVTRKRTVIVALSVTDYPFGAEENVNEETAAAVVAA